MTTRAPDRIELTIEEVILDGASPADRNRIASVFANRLQRYLEARATHSAWMPREIARLDAGSVDLRTDDAHTLGSEAADAVGRALSNCVVESQQ
jgi:hypothetical protein